jgi:hypothetical protein
VDHLMQQRVFQVAQRPVSNHTEPHKKRMHTPTTWLNTCCLAQAKSSTQGNRGQIAQCRPEYASAAGS